MCKVYVQLPKPFLVWKERHLGLSPSAMDCRELEGNGQLSTCWKKVTLTEQKKTFFPLRPTSASLDNNICPWRWFLFIHSFLLTDLRICLNTWTAEYNTLKSRSYKVPTGIERQISSTAHMEVEPLPEHGWVSSKSQGRSPSPSSSENPGWPVVAEKPSE